MARKLERQLQQFKAKQPLASNAKVEMEALESQDPLLVEELLNKKKWSQVHRDPSRQMKLKDLNSNSYFDVNSLPKNQRDLVVNKKMIADDKKTCDRILNGLLSEKKDEEIKKNLLAKDREMQRIKLRERHNKTHELEEKCGVRIGSVTNLNNAEGSSRDDYFLNNLMPGPNQT